MIRFLVLAIGLIMCTYTQAQIYQPVTWSFSYERLDEETSTYELKFKATIEEGWAVYSQYLERDDGPIATELSLTAGDHFEIIGQSDELSDHKKSGYDAIFEMNLTKYFKSLTLVQQVVWHDTLQPIEGYVLFMTCDDERCLPPAEESFSLSTTTTTSSDSDRGASLSTAEENLNLYGVQDILPPTESTCDSGNISNATESGKGYAAIFVLGMLGGFLALLTPCVFPLIPLTVSFFSKRHEKKKSGVRDAVLYGAFIMLVYVLISVPFHLLDSVNPDILNDISTNIWLNLLFFAVFLVFAFSFFGFYELTLPSGLTNRVSAAEGIGGILGIFFMALTLSLVSFSCTGPILGTLLAGTLTGGAWQLTAGIAGFGLALALPFALFALFPSWLNKLPKSGAWMNQIKIVLGFVELALALKFLSNADLVMGWGVLKYELFLGLWILIAFCLALFVFGLLRFRSTGPVKKLSLARGFFGFALIAFTVYLGTGLLPSKQYPTYQSLKLLSGLAPPASYSWKYPSDCPLGLNCYKDFAKGVEAAEQSGRPILLDFTGYACVNCREMEENVWSQPEVFDYLSNEYVLISLYVDAKTPLREEEQLIVNKAGGGTRKLRNVGHKWAHFQTNFFQTNAQPYYVLLDPSGRQMLAPPVGYTPDVDEYVTFLDCGLNQVAHVTGVTN